MWHSYTIIFYSVVLSRYCHLKELTRTSSKISAVQQIRNWEQNRCVLAFYPLTVSSFYRICSNFYVLTVYCWREHFGFYRNMLYFCNILYLQKSWLGVELVKNVRQVFFLYIIYTIFFELMNTLKIEELWNYPESKTRINFLKIFRSEKIFRFNFSSCGIR